jgi:hypothetical protein
LAGAAWAGSGVAINIEPPRPVLATVTTGIKVKDLRKKSRRGLS